MYIKLNASFFLHLDFVFSFYFCISVMFALFFSMMRNISIHKLTRFFSGLFIDFAMMNSMWEKCMFWFSEL